MDQIGVGQPQLDLHLSVNGEMRQQDNTRQMIFPVDELLNFLDARIELRPGDLIFTGSTHGVGLETGRFLQPGDLIEASIDGIGALSNRVGTPRQLSPARAEGRLGRPRNMDNTRATTPAHNTPLRASTWSPLRHRAFFWLWTAGAMVNLAIWMQTVAAAWIMTTLSTSPLMVSLVQTAVSLPVFLFGLPGGVIADLVDRRKWLMLTQAIMLVAGLALSVLSFSGMLADWSLLLFTFLLGTGSALSMSAWMVTITSVLPRHQVPSAVALNGISTNAARALGPALAGALIAYWNAASVFVIIAGCFVGVIFLVATFTPHHQPEGLPAESFGGGLRSGLRYIRHSAAMTSALKQTFVFTLSASALWALLPLVAKHELGMDAGGYGLLMGFMGAGAVIGAFNLTAMYRRFPLRYLIVAGVIGFSLATFAAAVSQSRVVVCAMLLIAGMSWMAVNATISTVVQTCSANWVRAG